jgi:RimJ/RimL family protein N-acetyltransferase
MDDARLLTLWQSSSLYTGEFNDFGLPRRPVDDLIRKDGLISDHGGTLVVTLVVDGTPIGTVSWREVRYGPNPESLGWNIGISLAPDMRGRGFGSQAQRLLAEYLFATTPVHRIEASTDVDNLAEQRALEKGGFTRDGVLRGAQFRAGAWHDLAVYSVVRPATSPSTDRS